MVHTVLWYEVDIKIVETQASQALPRFDACISRVVFAEVPADSTPSGARRSIAGLDS